MLNSLRLHASRGWLDDTDERHLRYFYVVLQNTVKVLQYFLATLPPPTPSTFVHPRCNHRSARRH